MQLPKKNRRNIYDELYNQEWLTPISNNGNYKNPTCEVDLWKLVDFIINKLENEQMQLN